MARFTDWLRRAFHPLAYRQSPGSLPVVPLTPIRGTTGRLPGDSRPVGRVSEGFLGAVRLVLGAGSSQWFTRIHFAARHFWGRGRGFLASGLRPIVGGGPNPHPGSSQAWLVMHRSLIVPPFQKLTCARLPGVGRALAGFRQADLASSCQLLPVDFAYGDRGR